MSSFLDRLRAWDRWEPPVQGWGEVVKVVNAPEPVSLSECANEIERLNAENARLREALENLTRRCREYCFDKCRRDCEPRTECRFYRARAALAEKES